MEPQRFVMLGISLDSYHDVVWVMSQFSSALNSGWLNRKRKPLLQTRSTLWLHNNFARRPCCLASVMTQLRHASTYAWFLDLRR
jgi:hypothetical protein